MPPKARSTTDDQTVFLYHCLMNAGTANINFKAVGEALGVSVGAARMRWTRLKQTIEAVKNGEDPDTSKIPSTETTPVKGANATPGKKTSAKKTPANKGRATKWNKVEESEDEEPAEESADEGVKDEGAAEEVPAEEV